MLKIRVHQSVVALGTVLFCLTSWAVRGESLWLQDLISLHAEDVYGEATTQHRFQVHYLLPVDPESFDDSDIWVVSPEGFSQFATFEGAEPVTDVFAELAGGEHALLAAGLDPALWHHPDYVSWLATYSIAAERDGGWIAEDNGRYVVLLEPSEVAFQGGDHFVPPQYLGSFRMAMGEPAPAYPDAVHLSVTPFDDGSYVATLKMDYEMGGVELRSWGEVRRDGNRLIVDVDAVQAEGAAADGPLTLEHSYHLPELEAGSHAFTAMLGDRVLGREVFQVGTVDDPIPADVGMNIIRSDEGMAADVTVHFHPDAAGNRWRIAHWGESRLEGNTFFLEAEANGPHAPDAAVPVVQEHRYVLLPRDGGNGGGESEPVEFRTLDLVPGFLQPREPAQLVFRSAEQWSDWVTENWPLAGLQPHPEPPVDFAKEMVLAVFSGDVGQGVQVRVDNVTKTSDGLAVHYVTTLPGVMPEDDVLVRTGHLVAVPATSLPVTFEGSVIAFPSPPGEGSDGGPLAGHEAPETLENEADGADDDSSPGVYRVVFTINGVVYAESRFLAGDEDPDRIPARVELDTIRENGAWHAKADVFFTGYPYHSIAEWGRPVLRDQTFFIDANSVQVEFFTEPELPYVESHRYLLLREHSDGGGDDLAFARVTSPATITEPQQRVVQTLEEWYDLIGFVPGPNVRPIAPPVDLESHTLAVIALGESPNACYGVSVSEVFLADGMITIVYETRYPRDGEACAEVITYPTAMVAFPQRGLPIAFVEAAPGDAEPDVEEGPERGAVGKTYEVVFRIDGIVYALSSFTTGSEGPAPEPDEFLRLEFPGDGSRIHVHAAVHFQSDGTPAVVTSWGEPTVEGHVIRATVTTVSPGDEEPGEHAAEHVYLLEDLAPGSYMFVLEVDGEARSRAPFVVRPQDHVDDFLEWLQRLLAEAGGAEAGAGAFSPPSMAPDNLDGDRWRDFDEFLLGMNPMKGADVPSIAPAWLRGDQPGQHHLALRFHRRLGAAAHADFIVEASENLRDWVRDPALVELVDVRALDDVEGMEEVTVSLKTPADESPFRFLRLVLVEKSDATEE